MISNATRLDWALLKLIRESQTPIGQGSLALLLRRQGFSLSVPTVGRKLQTLEFEGLLRKIGVDGRMITDRGLEVLKRWDAESRLRGAGEELLEVLKRGDKKHILDLLASRRIIERETAFLAAHTSSHTMQRLQDILNRQSAEIQEGGLGIEEDVAFHCEIARASRNPVLHSLVSLLRNHERYNFVITSMRTVVGSRLVVEHKAILSAIEAHDPQGARDAMDVHLRSLATDLDRYWNRWVRGSRAAEA